MWHVHQGAGAEHNGKGELHQWQPAAELPNHQGISKESSSNFFVGRSRFIGQDEGKPQQMEIEGDYDTVMLDEREVIVLEGAVPVHSSDRREDIGSDDVEADKLSFSQLNLGPKSNTGSSVQSSGAFYSKLVALKKGLNLTPYPGVGFSHPEYKTSPSVRSKEVRVVPEVSLDPVIGPSWDTRNELEANSFESELSGIFSLKVETNEPSPSPEVVGESEKEEYPHSLIFSKTPLRQEAVELKKEAKFKSCGFSRKGRSAGPKLPGVKLPCPNLYEPFLHRSKGPCERCLELLRSYELVSFNKSGRHLCVMLVSGGCGDGCQRKKRDKESDRSPARLCKKCYFDTHR